MRTRTNPNPKPKATTKGQMLESVEKAIQKMEWPWDVKLTPKARRDLMRPENRVYLEGAYRWAQYVLTWEYGRLASDDRNADYEELLGAIRRMYTDKMWTWEVKE